MKDGSWVTMEAVASKVGLRNASTAASRLRDFASRADHHDPLHAWRYERKSSDVKGLYLYRLFLPELPFELKQAELPFAEAI